LSRGESDLIQESSLKVSVIISSFSSLDNTGFGGHYYSAITTVKRLREMHEVEIINIGDFSSSTLEKSDIRAKYIPLTYGERWGPNRQPLQEELAKFDPDVVIAFDLPSALIVRKLCVSLKCGFVFVKPGGKRLEGYFPNNRFQIFFYLKDLNWALNRFKKSAGSVVCIPNRVSVPNQDWDAIAELRRDLSIQENEIVIIRISRIVEAYRPSFMAALRLSKFLRQAGYPVRLIIIGTCQDEALLNEILEKKSEFDAVLTTPRYTKQASRYLKIADINIGVGRGFMEGCALGQHMMAINSALDLPSVVTQKTILHFFEENFSMRVNFPEEEESNKEKIFEILEKCKSGHRMSEFSEEYFKENFSDEKILPLYNKVLYAARNHPEGWTLDLLRGEFRLKGRLNIGLRKYFKIPRLRVSR
jgi:hypothetical protein